MLDLLITKQLIAIIYQEENYWKIAFGNSLKKTLPDRYDSLKIAVGKAKKLGFGGYIQACLWLGKSYLLNRRIKWKTEVVRFSDEKHWMGIFKRRHGNT
jgi:hypothetical protein